MRVAREGGREALLYRRGATQTTSAGRGDAPASYCGIAEEGGILLQITVGGARFAVGPFPPRPRTNCALGIWISHLFWISHLSAIPYSNWTIGASTALNHWIARKVLGMDEPTWRRVSEGGGTDAYVEGMESLSGGESKRGLVSRMRDIVVVRGALFPETVVESTVSSVKRDELIGDIDDDLLSGADDDNSNSTEKSIDELLATLGESNDDDDDIWKFDDDEDEKKDEEGAGNDAGNERMAVIMDELQMWRGRNESSPYEAWDADRKNEFDQWIENYVATLYPEADAGTVDKEATRASLLSEQPIDSTRTKEFWTKIGSGATEAESFLQEYRAAAQEKLNSMDEAFALTKEGSEAVAELEAILSVPFETQLDKIADMGTLRPILDAYAPGEERESFLERHAAVFLEGMEMEHLVPDPDGPIGLEDLGSDLREEMSREWKPSSDGEGGGEPRFSVEMVEYGTDEYGTTRAERARALFRLWNEHKANRARFEEALFKRGFLGLEEDGVRGRRRRNDKEKDEKK